MVRACVTGQSPSKRRGLVRCLVVGRTIFKSMRARFCNSIRNVMIRKETPASQELTRIVRLKFVQNGSMIEALAQSIVGMCFKSSKSLNSQSGFQHMASGSLLFQLRPLPCANE